MMRRKILIVAKTYPNISRKYRETVCTAGLLLDDSEQPLQWIRIYPVRFRDLDQDRRYKRWSIIEANIEKNPKDPRRESFRIEDESIVVIRQLDTKNAWQERRAMLLPFKDPSIRAIREAGRSLGLIKPKSISRFLVKPIERDWTLSQQAILDQGDLFREEQAFLDLEKIPYRFLYQFVDEEDAQHKYSILDWEILQLYRNVRNVSRDRSLPERESDALEKMKQKLEEKFMSNDIDLHFIVGNQQKYPKTFMIIGLFYPQLIKSQQMSLF
ncbi:MAG: hypothetical protein MH825_03945 [Cyanobacteria bacterium]|nr:hypothetical protein [Cyanobacteriota bacterium]